MSEERSRGSASTRDELTPTVLDAAAVLHRQFGNGTSGRDLRAFLDALPLTQVDLAMLELRACGGPIDVAVEVADARRLISFCDAMPSDAGARRLLKLAHLWAGPESALHRLVHRVWLEFDVSGPTLAVPSIFVGPNSQRRDLETFVGSSFRDVVREFFDTLELKGKANRAAVVEIVGRVAPPASVYAVGVMLSRLQSEFRVSISNVSAPATTLRALGWRGHGKEIARLARVFEGCGAQVDLQLAVRDDVMARVGLELRSTARLGSARSSWPCILTSLTSNSCMRPEARHSIEEWLATPSSPGLARRLSHVKLDFDGGSLRGAKAYVVIRRRGQCNSDLR